MLFSLIVLALILLYGGHCFSVWLPSKVTHSLTHQVRFHTLSRFSHIESGFPLHIKMSTTKLGVKMHALSSCFISAACFSALVPINTENFNFFTLVNNTYIILFSHKKYILNFGYWTLDPCVCLTISNVRNSDGTLCNVCGNNNFPFAFWWRQKCLQLLLMSNGGVQWNNSQAVHYTCVQGWTDSTWGHSLAVSTLLL